MRPRISAAMIVRDEEAFLKGCLESIAGVVDEIVIFDTGSKDRTVEIARSYGANVHERAWVNDFAAARNWALDAATGEWILYVDADERLSVPEGFDISTLLSDREAAAFTVLFQPRPGYTRYLEIRMFRNDPRIRFRGVIHETVHPEIREVCRSDGLVVKQSPLGIDHLGYEGDPERKRRRNLPLLREAVRSEPNRVFYWQQLGEICAAFGEHEEAVEAFRRVGEIARKERDNKKTAADAALALSAYARFQEAWGEDPLPTIDEGLDIYPGHFALLFGRAKAFVKLERYDEALDILQGLLAEDAATLHDPWIAYNERLFGDQAHQLMGVALLRMGRTAEAADAFERAAAAMPDDLGNRTRAIAIRAMAERAASASL